MCPPDEPTPDPAASPGFPPLPAEPTREQIADDLRRNPRYQPFFEGQHPDWVKDFIKSYAHEKYMALRYGDFAERQLAGRLTQWEEEAYERLWDIQQKKLFDLQCRWRAGQVTDIPGVRTSYDFRPLSDQIENCRVIPPIAEAEFALYCEYLAQVDDYDDEVGMDKWGDIHWYDYDDFRAYEVDDDHENGYPLPAWYDFHNARTGAGVLLALPDVRTPKEKRYLDAHYAHRRAEEKTRKQQNPPPPPDPRPTWVAWDERPAIFQRFARQFETGRFQRQLAASMTDKKRRSEEEVDGVDDAVELLRALGNESYPMRAHPDWREALRLTAGTARRDKVLACLPEVYEAYKLREASGISHPAEDDSDADWLANAMNENILHGRELLGEPRNFDF